MSTPKEKSKKKGQDDEKDKPIVVKNAADLQRLKIEKLMKNPDKPVVIPDRPKGKNTPHVPEFVRNVMGSSAGAGSGEFHVYRHLRRKEYARQKFIQEKAEKETAEEEYHRKIEENKRKAEEETAKKRAKRLKKKKGKKFKKPKSEQKSESDSDDDSENDEEDKPDKASDPPTPTPKDETAPTTTPEDKMSSGSSDSVEKTEIME
ncbi:PRKR-interacting protein 1-like protein, partial [Frankliniella fusca]